MPETLDEANARLKATREALAAEPVQRLRLVSGAEPAGGTLLKDATGGRWHLVVHGIAWRAPGEPLVREEVRLEFPYPDDDHADWIADVARTFSVFEAEASTGVDVRGRRWMRATSFERLSPGTDPELDLVIEDERTPVSVRHAPFGRLRLDRAAGVFTGTGTWAGRDVEVELARDGGDGLTAKVAAKVAQKVLRKQDDHEVRRREALATSLHAVWDRTWREDAPALSPEAFADRLPVTSVEIHGDGSVSWWSDDDGLFAGHTVVVRDPLDGGPVVATMMG